MQSRQDSTLRCFLVDDDLDDQEIFCMALLDLGETVDCIRATDGVQALEALNAEPYLIPDVFFIDMNMPRMNGMQCLQAIKKIDRLRHIPVYMCSTSSDPRVIAETRIAGAADFIIKPSNIAEFTSKLARIMQELRSEVRSKE